LELCVEYFDGRNRHHLDHPHDRCLSRSLVRLSLGSENLLERLSGKCEYGLLTRENMKFASLVGVGPNVYVLVGWALGAALASTGLCTTTGIALAAGFFLASLAPLAMRTFAAASEMTIPFFGSMIGLPRRGFGGLFCFGGFFCFGGPSADHLRPASSASTLMTDVGRSAAATYSAYHGCFFSALAFGALFMPCQWIIGSCKPLEDLPFSLA